MKVRNKQCAKCPWKKSTNPREIPGGYCEAKHRALTSTMADPDDPGSGLGQPMRLMGCHESPVGAEQPCVGWVANQLGPGNNLALRLLALDGRFKHIELDGEQHETLEETFPR